MHHTVDQISDDIPILNIGETRWENSGHFMSDAVVQSDSLAATVVGHSPVHDI